MSEPDLQFISVSNTQGEAWKIATLRRSPVRPTLPTVFWLSGFNSDMRSTKATALCKWTARKGWGFLSFDYSGHGESSGRFEDGTIGDWLRQARHVLNWAAPKPLLVVGSSMGGWIALLLMHELARKAPELAGRVSGLTLIAPAWNMTELIWEELPEDARAEIEQKGVFHRPSEYGDGSYPITRKLIEEGRTHLIGDDLFETGCPVRILQGMRDQDVSWPHSLTLVDLLRTEDVHLTLIRDGEHRLSRPGDLGLLFATLEALADDLATANPTNGPP